MNSMTGFGRGEATNGDVTVVVELKSVNNRFRDINARLPRSYLVLEPRIHKLLGDSLQRGRIDCFLRRSAVEGGPSVQADPVLAERYLRAMSEVCKRLQRDPKEIPLELILGQPGVLTAAEDEPDALTDWDLVETALQAALADLLEMRSTEGAALKRDLRTHLDDLQRLWAEVQASAEGITERLHARLHERVQRLLADKADPARLAQEAALLADKADISEELARLRSHFKQFSDAVESPEPVGRKLEFLVQELNREINTIGSKAAEHPVSSRVVDMKSVLERIREQAANVE